MTYEIVLLTGKIIEFEADNCEEIDGGYVFYVDDEVVGEFDRRNIAGYIAVDSDGL